MHLGADERTQVKQIFEEENEKRSLLENVKAGLEAEIKRTQRVRLSAYAISAHR